jgi:hypothetical protein
LEEKGVTKGSKKQNCSVSSEAIGKVRPHVDTDKASHSVRQVHKESIVVGRYAEDVLAVKYKKDLTCVGSDVEQQV